jgi:hypothetical protein
MALPLHEAVVVGAEERLEVKRLREGKRALLRRMMETAEGRDDAQT